MRHFVKLVLLLALLVGGFVAITRWPHLNDVETGRTPEYPDLRPRDYGASEDAVAKAAKAAVEGLPRWTFVGAGRGPGGSELRAVAETRVFHFKDDVTVRIRRDGGRTKVSVRSKSQIGKWDFGQNARNISEFLAELDRRMFLP
jgi:uncharacterized protein (DUF1499 family)